MAHRDTTKGKMVRRFGVNIFEQVKYDRLLARKKNGPGKDPSDRRRRKMSVYGLQLTEKQKLKFTYGMSERQFSNLYRQAKRTGGITSDQLLILLERRLDNVIFRLGWAVSRAQARQMVTHNHILVNGRRQNIPSARVDQGDLITLKPKEHIRKEVRKRLSERVVQPVPWLSSDEDTFTARVLASPDARTAAPDIDTQLVVEYYARR